MIRPLILSTLLTVAASSLAAQKKPEKIGRDIERAMEQVGREVERTVERTVEQALRSVDRSLEKTRNHDWDLTIERIVDNALAQGQQPRRSSRTHDDDERFQDSGERIDTTFTFSRSGIVDLTSMAGDIIVTGWSRGEARVRATAERGRLRWSFSSSRLTIETESYRGGRNGDTRYEVSVPEGVRVILHSTSGDLTARGTRGSVDASTNGGDIEVVDATDVELVTLSGDITASRLRGVVEATTVSGSAELQDLESRSVRVESTSGDVVLAGVRSKDVTGSTVSGEVSYRGTIESGGQYEFNSHSGNVTLDIPANVSARFSVETFSGELDAGGFPVTLQPDRNRQGRSSRRLEFTLGSGDARVIAETFSGNVELRRDTRR